MPGEAPPDIYLRFSDGDSPIGKLLGESVDAALPGWWSADSDDKGWFMVTSFQFSISGDKGGSAGKGASSTPATGGTSGTSGGSGTASGTEVFKGITVNMPLQLGCISLMYRCVQFAQKQQAKQQFDKIPNVEIRVRRAGLSDNAPGEGSGQATFLWIFLTNVTVESYSMNSSCIQETFTLNYETMLIQYWATNPETRQLTKDTGDGYTFAKWSINAADDAEDDQPD